MSQVVPSQVLLPAGSVAFVQLAFEVASSVDLDHAQRLVQGASERETIRRERRAPEYFEFRPAPLRVDVGAPSIRVADRWATNERVEITVFDFGALAVTYAVPIQVALADLPDLADALYENSALLADARARVEAIMRQIGPALRRPALAALVEDYVIYRVPGVPGIRDWPEAMKNTGLRRQIAGVLRAQRVDLSPQELDDALACAMSYAVDDVTVIDWNAALVVGDEGQDVLAVLEFANVELLEMRYMDDRLDAMLDAAYESQRRPGGLGGAARLLGLDKRRAEMRRLAAMQVDSALLFEGINNALKLLGDQFLARVYRLAAQRLHLPEWDASILRKLSTLQSIYQKWSDEQATLRMELLEILIIVLILISIVLPFVVPGSK